ncbi:hypothetical protein CCAX7_54350 [Capsulimonas corticalis]|uniref:Uncharacterized protein n=1 Tax=Capsulimonas corticalis TaxID=2219043 RepID=A0A402CNM1_9BACT|nr:hypothetical protein [Capsulimonas corticalis]BDI33384.1 hypothetical protein CCAX7_54350 [Capsulimonas corticalis]
MGLLTNLTTSGSAPAGVSLLGTGSTGYSSGPALINGSSSSLLVTAAAGQTAYASVDLTTLSGVAAATVDPVAAGWVNVSSVTLPVGGNIPLVTLLSQGNRIVSLRLTNHVRYGYCLQTRFWIDQVTADSSGYGQGNTMNWPEYPVTAGQPFRFWVLTEMGLGANSVVGVWVDSGAQSNDMSAHWPLLQKQDLSGYAQQSIDEVRFGTDMALAGAALMAAYDGLFFGNGAALASTNPIPFVSYTSSKLNTTTSLSATSVVSSTAATVQATSSASPLFWLSSDPAAASISNTGLLTLHRAAGAIVTVSDGSAFTDVEFAARTATYSVGSCSLTGSTLSVPLTLTSFSDGAATNSYPDAAPLIVGSTSVQYQGVSGTAPNFTASFLVSGGAPYTFSMNGATVSAVPGAGVTVMGIPTVFTLADDSGVGVSGATFASGYAIRPTTTPSAIALLGAWSSVTAYTVDQAVTLAGVGYIAVAGSTNVTPGTDITKWVPWSYPVIADLNVGGAIAAAAGQYVLIVDPTVNGELFYCFVASKGGSTISGLNAQPCVFVPLDSSRLDQNVSAAARPHSIV